MNDTSITQRPFLNRAYRNAFRALVLVIAFFVVSFGWSKICERYKRIVHSFSWNGKEIQVVNRNPLGFGFNDYDVESVRTHKPRWEGDEEETFTLPLTNISKDRSSVIREEPNVTVDEEDRLVIEFVDERTRFPADVRIVYSPK